MYTTAALVESVLTLQPAVRLRGFVWLAVTQFAFATVTFGQPPESVKTPSRYPPEMPGSKAETYKSIAGTDLKLYIFTPAKHRTEDRRPAIVFFFGGGFKGGTPAQFEKHCQYFASRGIVAIAADYRVRSRNGTGIATAIEDGRDAVRWVRANAGRLGIDPQKLIGSGGSAGGMLAACLGIMPNLSSTLPDPAVSYVPNALVLFNPAMFGPPASDEDEREQAADESKRPRLVAQVRRGLPPCLMFFGTNDKLLAGAREFQQTSVEIGNRCEIKTWEGVGHGFFNFGRDKNRHFVETIVEADEFLASLGYLQGEPTIQSQLKLLERKKAE